MLENWIAKAVGLMHINNIDQSKLATHIGIRRDYLNKILNGKISPNGSEERIMTAIEELILKENSHTL